MLGIFRITNDGVYFTEKEMMDMMLTIESFDGNLPPPHINDGSYKRWTGRQLISLILPPVNMSMANKSCKDNDEDKLNYVKIRDGIINQGRFDKDIISKGTKGLVHVIFNDFGEKACQRFLDNIQDVVTKYLLITGFSVGISDLISDEDTKKKMEKIIVGKKKEVSEVIQHVHLNIFKNDTGKTNSEEFESNINVILNKCINDAGSVGLKSLDINNRMTNMVSSGSKGSPLNVSQMIACLGQQNVDGKRIPYGFVDRTLPHFLKYDDSPEARGFVENSFIGGLTPQEFFFHAMGGREGLIDTAVKTAETGYIQRKLIKAMEDLKIDFNLSVKNSYGKIIQFMYGDDGYHYNKIESQYLDLLDLSVDFDTLEKRHRFMDDTNWELFLEDDTIEELTSDNKYKEKLNTFYRKIYDLSHELRGEIYKNRNESNINYPINLYRLVNHAINLFNIEKDDLSDLNPLYVIDTLKELETILKKKTMDEMSKLFMCLIYSYLSPKRLIVDRRINQITFDYIVNMIKTKYKNSFIPVGEMVGAIAAQSIGEPATQMTLNTFHFAGIGAKSNVTRGVPRLKELLHISKNIKSPSLAIYLNDDIAYDRHKVQEVANKIALTTLRDLVTSSSIYYDPSDSDTLIDNDNPFMDIYKIFKEIEDQNEDMDSKWVLRLEFSRRELMNRNICMEDVHQAIFSVFEKTGFYSDDNAEKIIFRLRLNIDSSKNDDKDILYLKNYENNILNIVVKGIDKITNTILDEDRNNTIYEDGNYKIKKQWVIYTDGTNMIDILSNPYVNSSRTYSNDVIEVYNLLGIDAARKLLIKEIKEVIDTSGNYVNHRHISLLCDFMTSKGILMSIDRFGINRDVDIGPLAKCSFEETTEQIYKAAIFGDIDNLDGVSANIMMGQLIPSGTGNTKVLLDEMKLLDIKKPDTKKEEEVEEDNYCANHLGMDFDIDDIEAEM